MDVFSHVPSWDQIERNLQRSFGHLNHSVSNGWSYATGRLQAGLDQAYGQLGGKRIESVRHAIYLSFPMVRTDLEKRWASIEIDQILDVLLKVVKEVTLILGGSAALGSVAGGVAGSAAFGIGAAPGAVAGAGIGLEVGNLILASLGLAAIAEYFYQGLPDCLRTLREGFAIAWSAEHGQASGAMNPASGADSRSRARVEMAAKMLARGQEQLVVLFLMALATYLMRGSVKAGIKANLNNLASRSAALQAQITEKRLATWLARNQQRLLEQPELQLKQSALRPEPEAAAAERLVPKKTTPEPAAAPVNQGFEAVYAKAPAAKAEIDTLADGIAAKYNGSVAKAPIKSAQRALEKINNDYGGDATKIKDLARNTIIVDDDKILSVTQELRDLGANVKVLDGSVNPMGYSGVNSSLMTRAGIVGEIQVNSPAMIYAKEPEALARVLLGNDTYDNIATASGLPGGLGHAYYEQWRVLDADTPAAQAIAEQSKNYYNTMREANAR